MPSPELQMVLEMLRSAPPFAGDIATRRANLEVMATAAPPPADIVYQPTTMGGVPAEWTSAEEHDPHRVLLYLHGGGYCIGSVATHRGLTGPLARAARARVLSLGYRLAPEHPFPAAIEDAVTAYRGLLDSGQRPERLAIGGDSAGGGLTIATLLTLRDRKLPMPGAAVALSPWLDLTQSGDSIRTRDEIDPMLHRSDLELFANEYLGDHDPRDPLASPLFADLGGLPPLLLQVGTAEVLLDDTLRFAAAARRAGVEVSVDAYDDMFHVWQAFEAFLPEAKDAIGRLGDFLRRL